MVHGKDLQVNRCDFYDIFEVDSNSVLSLSLVARDRHKMLFCVPEQACGLERGYQPRRNPSPIPTCVLTDERAPAVGLNM